MKNKKQNWFYSNTVKEHFFNPKNILQSKKGIKSFKADGVGIAGHPVCGDVMKMWIKVDEKKDKIVDCKWQTFGSLIRGEKVLIPNYFSEKVENITINSEVLNENGNPAIVEENLIRNYSGKILTYSLSTSKFYHFSVTPNHPIPCFERDGISKIVRKKGTRWSEIAENKLQKANSVLKSASQLRPGDFLIFKINKKIKDAKELNGDFCKLLGYYVSDGSLSSINRAIFYFGLNEIEYLNDLENLANKNKWSYKTFKRNTENVLCFQLNEPEIIELLKKHGGLPSKKNFSEKVMSLPPKKQMMIVTAYINGDGWISKQNENWEEQYFISTSQENLAYQLQMMLARNLVFAPIHQRGPRQFKSKGKTYINKGELNLIFRKKHQYSRIKYHKKEHAFLIPIQRIIVSDYKGKIYDIGLSDEPKVYKIKGISLHNCASAIASTSMLSVMITEKGGMPISKVLKIKPKVIAERLGGLPQIKFHCSMLGERALRNALNDYFKKSGQHSRIIKE